MITPQVLKLLQQQSDFYHSPIHGINHWRNVQRNGLYLANYTNADIHVISYFAHFHDCKRENENIDPKHGLRGARFAEQYRHLIDLNDVQFKQLLIACKGHTYGKRKDCATVNTCWDADRLDLRRVGVKVLAENLHFPEAKRIANENDFAVLGMSESSAFKEKFYPRA